MRRNDLKDHAFQLSKVITNPRQIPGYSTPLHNVQVCLYVCRHEEEEIRGKRRDNQASLVVLPDLLLELDSMDEDVMEAAMEVVEVVLITSVMNVVSLVVSLVRGSGVGRRRSRSRSRLLDTVGALVIVVEKDVRKRVNWYRQAAVGDPKYDHIDLSEKQKHAHNLSCSFIKMKGYFKGSSNVWDRALDGPTTTNPATPSNGHVTNVANTCAITLNPITKKADDKYPLRPSETYLTLSDHLEDIPKDLWTRYRLTGAADPLSRRNLSAGGRHELSRNRTSEDIPSSKDVFEPERAQSVTGVDAYMKTFKVPESVVIDKLKKMVENAWKEINDHYGNQAIVVEELENLPVVSSRGDNLPCAQAVNAASITNGTASRMSQAGTLRRKGIKVLVNRSSRRVKAFENTAKGYKCTPVGRVQQTVGEHDPKTSHMGIKTPASSGTYVNDYVKTNYDQMESDEPHDENSMEYSDQSELSDAYYTKKLRKVNKEDRQDGDKLSRQECVSDVQIFVDCVYIQILRLNVDPNGTRDVLHEVVEDVCAATIEIGTGSAGCGDGEYCQGSEPENQTSSYCKVVSESTREYDGDTGKRSMGDAENVTFSLTQCYSDTRLTIYTDD
ncbi:germacrene A synthase 1 [Tanacetum coccineum]